MIGANKRRMVAATLAFVCICITLSACSSEGKSDSAEGDTGSKSAGELAAWTPDSDCVNCHVFEAESATDTACAYSLHADVECITCHANTDGSMAKAHERYETAKQPAKLKRTEVTSGVCLSCHIETELKEATADVTALTDGNGTVVNPHDLPQTEDHADAIACSSCHKMHLPESAIDTAPQACLSCHHDNVYECGTCHD